MTRLDVLYEDNHLLVINKPAGIPTMGAQSGATVHSLAAEYLKRKYDKPGRAYVGIVSRLDTVTSGVLVLARTSKAASRLSEQFSVNASDNAKQGVTKIYLAAVAGQVDPESTFLVDYVRKDDDARRMRVVGDSANRAQLARLRYQRILARESVSIVAVQLLSGRKHQIRLQFADRGHPVIGDRKYGSDERFPAGIALHSWRLQITHPTKRQPMWFEAELPKTWKQFGRIENRADLRERVARAFGLQTDQHR